MLEAYLSLVGFVEGTEFELDEGFVWQLVEIAALLVYENIPVKFEETGA